MHVVATARPRLSQVTIDLPPDIRLHTETRTPGGALSHPEPSTAAEGRSREGYTFPRFVEHHEADLHLIYK